MNLIDKYKKNLFKVILKNNYINISTWYISLKINQETYILEVLNFTGVTLDFYGTKITIKEIRRADHSYLCCYNCSYNAV